MPPFPPHLRVEILRVLDACQGYLLPQSTLHNQLRLFLAPAPDEAELRAALKSLAAQSLALSVESSLDGATRWKITDRGRALLLEHLRP
jgi:hypothetical protein